MLLLARRARISKNQKAEWPEEGNASGTSRDAAEADYKAISFLLWLDSFTNLRDTRTNLEAAYENTQDKFDTFSDINSNIALPDESGEKGEEDNQYELNSITNPVEDVRNPIQMKRMNERAHEIKKRKMQPTIDESEEEHI